MDNHRTAIALEVRNLRKAYRDVVAVDGLDLEVRSGDTSWKYAVDKTTLFLKENSRWVKGQQVEITRYSGFRPNTGIKTAHFKF